MLKFVAPSGAALEVPTPVVLAPMAGVTNLAYRTLCREQGAGLYVCEMITSRGVVERIPKTFAMMRFAPDETVRSVQLYGVNADVMARAAHILCEEVGVHHIDLNFGCPVPKVTRRGGGGVLPWKTDRLEAILTATVRAADAHGVPVTVKTRLGIDADHETFLDVGRIAEQAGCAAIALHARTVLQAYGGRADWERIAELVASVSIPVLGNGDIWEASDALEMVDQTGCAGVVIGRGCLGRPWLFRDLADAFAGRSHRALPTLGEVAATVRRHAELMVEIMGTLRADRPAQTYGLVFQGVSCGQRVAASARDGDKSGRVGRRPGRTRPQLAVPGCGVGDATGTPGKSAGTRDRALRLVGFQDARRR